VISTAERVHRDLPLNCIMERYMESYAAEVAAFVDAVLHDKPVTERDGRAPVVMGLAAKKSLAEGRPVRLIKVSA
jgi:myo-inositol 2-dehydrogenase/D-chiro-inositol 1-dehydrogenase